MTRRILVTSALPYANGGIHLGHLVEYIQTDIWVRFQKMQGHEVHYVVRRRSPTARRSCCAPTRKASRPEQLIARVYGEHTRDFAGFHVAFDNYYTTNSPENRAFCEDIYNHLQGQGPDRQAFGRAVLRSGQADVSARPIHQGRVPEAATRRTSTATPAKSAAPPIRPPISSIRTRRFQAPSRSARPPSTISSGFPTSAARNSCGSSPRPATACSRKRPTR